MLNISGMAVNLSVLASWIFFIWLGLFLVYSFNPEGIVDSSGREATVVERIYFTGYVLSTLGIGNFKPTTPFFEILTSLFSFYGFVFFSTSMTYLLSVSSAVAHKWSLASSINSLGSNPSEIVNKFLKMDSSFSYQQISNLQQMIGQYSINYKTYPVFHYFHNADGEISIGTSIARLDEAVSIMLNNRKFDPIREELQMLRESLDQLFKNLKKRFRNKADEEPEINWYNLQLPEDLLMEGFSEDQTLPERRKILTGMLQNENRNWKNVYPNLA
ncbi:potassium channel family protein [Nafulsella turpanensis]|uniref:potassium channel family protein n=1 Tax=Nafulsella turpanensis TaxID=1265690 RepID=UPI000345733D|nr:potassium channel family protein [Nafulsella turpanensis]